MRVRAGGALIAGLACMASVMFADRPLIIDDADPQDFKQIKIEGGAWYEKQPDCMLWDIPFGVTAGVYPGLELGAGFGGQLEELTEIDAASGKEHSNTEIGIGDLTLAAKWRFLDESTWIPRQALTPSVKLPTADKDKGLGTGQTDYDITWLASKSLSARMGAHLNIGYAFIGRTPDKDLGDLFHYGVALDYKIIDSATCDKGLLQWVGEVFAVKELRRDQDTDVMFNTGLRWNAVGDLVVDAAAGSCLAGDAPDLIATAGLTWTFGFAQAANK